MESSALSSHTLNLKMMNRITNWSATFGGIKDEGDIVRDSRNLKIDQERAYISVFGITDFRTNGR